jgi:hypothetical protein
MLDADRQPAPSNSLCDEALFDRLRVVIREIQLSTANPDDEEIYEPPTGVLRIAVIGDDVHLDWHAQLAPDAQPADTERPASCSFRLSARSLLLALRAAWADEHPRSAHQLSTHSGD